MRKKKYPSTFNSLFFSSFYFDITFPAFDVYSSAFFHNVTQRIKLPYIMRHQKTSVKRAFRKKMEEDAVFILMPP